MATKTKSSTAGTTSTQGPADATSTNTQSLSDNSGSAVSGLVDSAKEAVGQAKDAATNVLGQARDQAASRADQQRQTLASGMQAVAQAFHSLGSDLGSKEQGPVAQYAAEIGHAIGGQVEQVASYLQNRDVRQLITETEDFARRSPAIFLGSAFALGLMASRFLKSSRPASESSQSSAIPGPGMPGAPLALPAASTPVPETDSDMPSGFPFSPARSSQAQPGTDPLGEGAMSTSTEPVSTGSAGV